jgi:hypothetical protein
MPYSRGERDNLTIGLMSMLEAFHGIRLITRDELYQARRHLMALSAFQQHALAVLECSPAQYARRCEDSPEPCTHERSMRDEKFFLSTFLQNVGFAREIVPAGPGFVDR